jgi:hypothetical protein
MSFNHSPPPGRHLRLFWRKKKHQVIFPATTEQNIALVNFFLKPSDSSILMAIDAINAIFSDQVNP